MGIVIVIVIVVVVLVGRKSKKRHMSKPESFFDANTSVSVESSKSVADSDDEWWKNGEQDTAMENDEQDGVEDPFQSPLALKSFGPRKGRSNVIPLSPSSSRKNSEDVDDGDSKLSVGPGALARFRNAGRKTINANKLSQRSVVTAQNEGALRSKERSEEQVNIANRRGTDVIDLQTQSRVSRVHAGPQRRRKAQSKPRIKEID